MMTRKPTAKQLAALKKGREANQRKRKAIAKKKATVRKAINSAKTKIRKQNSKITQQAITDAIKKLKKRGLAGANKGVNGWSRGRKRYFGGNSGYVGYSKSRRAVEAEYNGLRNKSQMNREFLDEVNDILLERGAKKITLKKIKDNLANINADEWHHTSKYGNRTDYYSAETIATYFLR